MVMLVILGKKPRDVVPTDGHFEFFVNFVVLVCVTIKPNDEDSSIKLFFYNKPFKLHSFSLF